MRGLFGDVVAFRFVRVLPEAGISLAEDGIQGLLDATESMSVASVRCEGRSVPWLQCTYGGLICQPLR